MDVDGLFLYNVFTYSSQQPLWAYIYIHSQPGGFAAPGAACVPGGPRSAARWKFLGARRGLVRGRGGGED